MTDNACPICGKKMRTIEYQHLQQIIHECQTLDCPEYVAETPKKKEATTALPLPSERLKSRGWIPVRPDAHPRETQWIDPRYKIAMNFIEALMVQDKRDEAK